MVLKYQWLRYLFAVTSSQILTLSSLYTTTNSCYCTAGTFRWCKILQKCAFTEAIFAVSFSQNECIMLWPHFYQLMAMPTNELRKLYWMTKQRSMLVQQSLSLPFVCDLCNYESIRNATVDKKSWFVEHEHGCMILTLTVSDHLSYDFISIFIVDSAVQQPFRGKQRTFSFTRTLVGTDTHIINIFIYLQ